MNGHVILTLPRADICLGSSLECENSSLVFLFQSAGHVAGCCSTDTEDFPCYIPTTCIPLKELSASCDASCSSDPLTTRWYLYSAYDNSETPLIVPESSTDSDKPKCITNSLTDIGYTDLSCGSATYSDTVFLARVPTIDVGTIDASKLSVTAVVSMSDYLSANFSAPVIMAVLSAHTGATSVNSSILSSSTTSLKSLTRDEKINIGVGIGVGLGVGIPSTIATVIMLWLKLRKRRKT